MSQHHDPVHPDSGHLTAEVLADLDLGLLDAASAEHARQHLLVCPQCVQLHTDLATLAESLRTLGEQPTEPMPDAVWQQISGALASDPVVTPEGSATVVPLADSRKRRPSMPGVGLVAGVAGLALVGAIVVGIVSDDGTNMASSSGDDSGAESATAPLSVADFEATRSGTHYKLDELGQQVTALVAVRRRLFDALPGGTADQSVAGDASLSPSPGTSVSSTPSPAGTGASTVQVPPGDEVKALRRAPMATDPAAAEACVAGLLDSPDVAPLAVDIGLWQGQPAAVVVLPVADDPTQAEVWVIDPTCTETASSSPIYYWGTVSR